MAFWNEVQYLATQSLDDNPQQAIVKGLAIQDRFYYAPHQLQAHGTGMVVDYSFDTDSAED